MEGWRRKGKMVHRTKRRGKGLGILKEKEETEEEGGRGAEEDVN